MDKRSLTERDICTKFILPAVKSAGWDEMVQVREEVYFTKGRIIVRGKLVTRGKAKKADFVLYYKPNIPIALIEAKDNIIVSATESNRASTTRRRWIFPSCFPRTATASSFTTAPA
jgi:type I site-specific restriction endonuclease